jgi:hypothetical protein
MRSGTPATLASSTFLQVAYSGLNGETGRQVLEHHAQADLVCASGACDLAGSAEPGGAAESIATVASACAGERAIQE